MSGTGPAEKSEKKPLKVKFKLPPGQATQQETGVTGTSSTTFGPARLSYYPADAWAMTVAPGNEVSDSTEPASMRKRGSEPAFLTSNEYSNELPALITILHAIPEVRNAFLCSDFALTDYGKDADWWKGSSATGIRTTDSISTPDQDTPGQETFVAELQRLMAFLDSTERKYGSAQLLMQIPAFEKFMKEDSVSTFLRVWYGMSRSRGFAGQQLFCYNRTKVESDSVRRKVLEHDLAIAVSNGDVDASFEDILEKEVYPPDEKAAELGFEEFPEVFVVRLTNAVRVSVPALLNVAPYLIRNTGVITSLREREAESEMELARIDQKINRIGKKTHNGVTGEVLVLIQRAMTAFGGPVQPTAEGDHASTTSGQKQDGKIESNGLEPSVAQKANALIVRQLQAVYDRVQEKLNVLEKKKTEIRESIAHQRAQLRSPTPQGDHQNPPWSLRGISLNGRVTYVLLPPSSTTTTDTDGTVPVSQGPTWWRLEERVAAVALEESDVLDQVTRDITGEVMLVYASPSMLKPAVKDLPTALVEFVKRDNEFFHDELAQEAQQEEQRQAGGIEKDDVSKGWDSGGPPPYNPWEENNVQDIPLDDLPETDRASSVTLSDGARTTAPAMEMTEKSRTSGLMAQLSSARSGGSGGAAETVMQNGGEAEMGVERRGNAEHREFA
ncbi:hypothetical protein H2201_008114 [Coniosporium apollinis]|uniref:Ubiquitin interaction motif protein n=1 Tax=Coniosporium apollinis TaxID=61459 RepID=A0ABQ9NHT1_9PEZI|nr:hypothetical protein H2201_008114 [Coniosporium apollinis]